MPYQCRENEDTYLEDLGVLSALLEELDHTSFVVMGDWNANLKNPASSLFAKHMLDFCCDHNLRVSTHQLLPSESYTYVSDSWGTESWLDHAVSSEDFHNAIDDIKICYNVTDEDHIPTTLCIAIELIPDLSSRSANSCMSKLNWENLSDTDCKKYTEITRTLLENIVVNDNIKCESISCNDTCHVEAVSKLYDDIINCLKEASDKAFPSTSNRGYTTMPGWSEYVADLYKTSRDVREMWLGAGRPRNGHIFDLHMRTKARCKYAIRFIKRNEKQMRKESLAKKLSTLDNSSFWKEVRHMNNCNTPLPTTIDGVTGEANIAGVWRKHFEDLLNCQRSTNSVVEVPNDNLDFNDLLVSKEEIVLAIKGLENNKSYGLDGIYAEHLKFASCNLVELLSLCFTSFFLHSVLPDSLISVILVPVIKDKAGNITSKDNHRPIALASIVSKVVELILLNRLSDVVATAANQFGFKKKHSTDQAIYVIKEVIDAYRVLNGSMFVCFLDASKAFDRVNHSVLFDKLIRRGTPSYIVRLLIYWYANQKMCIRWGGGGVNALVFFVCPMALGRAGSCPLTSLIFMSMT